MDRRRALAAAAAVALSITGLAVAVGATTQVFTAADASPDVGRVSPVSQPANPPVETHIVDVTDPEPTSAPAPAPAPGAPVRSGTREERAEHAPAPAAPPVAHATPAPTVAAHHEVEHEAGDD